MNSITEQRNGEDRRSGDYQVERGRMSIATASAVIVFIVGLVVTYYASVNTTDAAAAESREKTNARVSVLETQRESDKERLQRIEEKVDRLLQFWRREP